MNPNENRLTTNQIVIISDTHDNRRILPLVLKKIEEINPIYLIYCGDATQPETVEWFCRYPIIYTFGNGDFAASEISRLLKALGPQNFAGFTWRGELLGKKIGATHGHLENEMKNLIDGEDLDYVFHGHTHQREDRLAGNTRIINPGALGGTLHESRSFAKLDLISGVLNYEMVD